VLERERAVTNLQLHIYFIYILQDGKVLPEGPVVISPDGLFPSLYREGNKSAYLCFLFLFTFLFLLYQTPIFRGVINISRAQA
jgi:hypothetical protein